MIAINWWRELRQQTGGVQKSWDLVNKYFPDQIPSGKGIALLEKWQIEEIFIQETNASQYFVNHT